jgi:hypothetical protein
MTAAPCPSLIAQPDAHLTPNEEKYPHVRIHSRHAGG